MKTKRIREARVGDLMLLGRTDKGYFAGSCYKFGDLIIATKTGNGQYNVYLDDGETVHQVDSNRRLVHELAILSTAKEMKNEM